MEGGLAELLRRHTDLGSGDIDRLHALVADWQLLADLSFADLLLFAPRRTDRAGMAPDLVVVAQMRPSTGPTSHQDDLVGRLVQAGERPLLDEALKDNRICREADPFWQDEVPVREETIPVPGRSGVPVAVVARHTNLAATRAPSRLELAYTASADELAQMLHEGSFPFPGVPVPADAIRVGDGLVRLDADGVVSFASPNAMSAYRRLGLTADLVGEHLGRTTARLVRSRAPVDEAVATVVSGRAPREGEVESRGAVVRLRAVPLLPGGDRIGALVLVRDVTELRRRDRQLLSKDATIREIHHRVKNNLQTVAALLRLQARRLDTEEARAALVEAVRRVGSIAIVHETLALTLDEAVAFDDIADRLVLMVADVAGGDAAGARVRVERTGTFGELPATVATPLAMVLTELVQNAVEHGLGAAGGSVSISAVRQVGTLTVEVSDDGGGLPEEFRLDGSTRLGLQIVTTLVTGELGGTITLTSRPEGGTTARIVLPLAEPPAPTGDEDGPGDDSNQLLPHSP